MFLDCYLASVFAIKLCIKPQDYAQRIACLCTALGGCDISSYRVLCESLISYKRKKEREDYNPLFLFLPLNLPRHSPHR